MAQARGLLDVRRLRQPARERARGAARRARADATTRASSSAPAAATRSTPRPSSPAATGSPARPARARAPDLPHARLPRHARLRHEHRRHRGQRDQLGPAGRRDVDRRLRLARRARAGDRRASAPERVAAFFCEPVIGAGGVYPPPDGYIEGVADLCARARHPARRRLRDLRLRPARHAGSGSSAGDVEPDMITFAKGVTSGYLPLGGVVVSGEVARAVLRAPAPMLPPRRDLRRPPDLLRRRAREPRHLRARGPHPARPRARAAAARRAAARSSRRRPSRRSAAAPASSRPSS